MALVSMPGLVSGASCALILPVVGWLTDRGPNPQHRKTLATVLAAFVLVSGMLCVLVANLLHLGDLADDSSPNGNNFSSLPGQG